MSFSRIESELSGARALCLSIHDVAPCTLDACRRIAQAVESVDATVPLTLLVVPRYHDDTRAPAEYMAWIEKRLARGDELALHGLTHRDEAQTPRTWGEHVRRRMYTAGEGEFAALSREEAVTRMELGLEWFAERGWPVRGFVAPAWLVSRGSWDALHDSGFLYTTTLGRFHNLRNGMVVRAPTVVYSTRSAWRRATSLAWNEALSHAGAAMPLLRIGFHPVDAAYPHVMAHALKLLDHLMRDRRALTKSAFARTLR